MSKNPNSVETTPTGSSEFGAQRRRCVRPAAILAPVLAALALSACGGTNLGAGPGVTQTVDALTQVFPNGLPFNPLGDFFQQ